MTARVSAVLITRSERAANVPPIVERVLECPEVGEVLIARDHPQRVWGRYALARRASLPLVYFQDDDALVDVADLLARYDEAPGVPACNIAETHVGFVFGQVYQTRTGVARLGMVGWGALFPAGLLRDVDRLIDRRFGPASLPLLFREADRIVTLLCPDLNLRPVDVKHLPGASEPGALSLEPDHAEWRSRAIERALRIRDEAAR